MTNSNTTTSKRASSLANRLLSGANLLASFAENLTQTQWQTPVLGDGRTVGVVVHHVANVYPLEIELSKILATGMPITEATKEVVDKMNADHAEKFKNVEKEEAIELLRLNSLTAAAAIRNFTDKELENAATVSLYSDAPLTAQFFIEDHALRHSYHHLAKIKCTLGK